MKLRKKELIISVIMMIVFLIVGFNLAVLATSDDGSQNILFPPANNNINTPNIITPGNNTADEENNENTGNTINIPIKDGEIGNANTNTPTEVPNTGLEDLPWVVIGICAVSAIFAYKKIKEYKED